MHDIAGFLSVDQQCSLLTEEMLSDIQWELAMHMHLCVDACVHVVRTQSMLPQSVAPWHAECFTLKDVRRASEASSL